MSERSMKALEYHKRGYNCAQSVACSFSDTVTIDEDTLFRVVEGFGGGMGGLKGTCGALSGAIAVAGLLRSEGKDQCKSKAQT
ncbi:MAG: C-GCAxxG-C-C family (seleno)protein, partial [Blautia sp.]